MRLYRIEHITIISTEFGEEIDGEVLIVPENALGNYTFQACEFIGTLDDAFELVPRKDDDNDPQKANVVKLKKD